MCFASRKRRGWWEQKVAKGISYVIKGHKLYARMRPFLSHQQQQQPPLDRVSVCQNVRQYIYIYTRIYNGSRGAAINVAYHSLSRASTIYIRHQSISHVLRLRKKQRKKKKTPHNSRETRCVRPPREAITPREVKPRAITDRKCDMKLTFIASTIKKKFALGNMRQVTAN